MKATAIAPANIAFIKYWGRKDDMLRLPLNGSISMNLSNLLTRTTVEFNTSLSVDAVWINGNQEEIADTRVVAHLDRIRKIAGINDKAKVVSENNFPSATGLSSSSSGFAALTVAGIHAAEISLSEKELSILARLGSGSACRSIPDGFVEWIDATTSEESYAHMLYKPEYWDIVDVVVLVSKNKKEVPSSQGHTLASSSPFIQARMSHMNKKIAMTKKFLSEKDFPSFGELAESEALELHAIYLTSTPSLIYLLPGTLRIMHLVKKWRQEGLPVYFTLNTGQDIHLLCEKKNVQSVIDLVKTVEGVQKAIINSPAHGARTDTHHLF